MLANKVQGLRVFVEYLLGVRDFADMMSFFPSTCRCHYLKFCWGQLAQYPHEESEGGSLNPSCLTKAFTFPTKYAVIRKNCLLLKKSSTLAGSLVVSDSTGTICTSFANFLHHSCDQAHSWPSLLLQLSPACTPRVSCLTGDLKSLWCLAPPCLSHPVFLSPSS